MNLGGKNLDKHTVLLAHTHSPGVRLRFRTGPELVVAQDGSYRRVDNTARGLSRKQKKARRRAERAARLGGRAA